MKNIRASASLLATNVKLRFFAFNTITIVKSGKIIVLQLYSYFPTSIHWRVTYHRKIFPMQSWNRKLIDGFEDPFGNNVLKKEKNRKFGNLEIFHLKKMQF